MRNIKTILFGGLLAILIPAAIKDSDIWRSESAGHTICAKGQRDDLWWLRRYGGEGALEAGWRENCQGGC